MTTTRVPSGTPTGGQFATSSRSEGAVVLTPPTPAIPERVAFVADDLVAMADSLWFSDHSYDPDDEFGDDPDDGDWERDKVNLAHMDDARVATNNCYMASSVALDAIYDIDPDVQPGLAHLTFATSDGAMDPVHYANTVTDPATGQMWVIDFTARQYDEGCDFPLVETVGAWNTRVADYAAARGWRVQSFEHEDC